MNKLMDVMFPQRSAIATVQSTSKWALRWSRLSVGSFAIALATLALAGTTHSLLIMKVGVCLAMGSVLLHAVAAGVHSNVYFDSRRALKAEPVYAEHREIHQRIKRSVALHWFGSTLVMAAVPLVPVAYLLPSLWVVLFGLTVGLFVAISYSTRTDKLLAYVGAVRLEA